MMAALFLLLFAAGSPTLDAIRADRAPEHRAKAAIDFALVSERALESASAASDNVKMSAELKNIVDAMELARDSFLASGKTPSRQPGAFKKAELLTHEMLIRLGDLERNIDPDQRAALEAPIHKVQEIHDAWFEGIMGKKQ